MAYAWDVDDAENPSSGFEASHPGGSKEDTWGWNAEESGNRGESKFRKSSERSFSEGSNERKYRGGGDDGSSRGSARPRTCFKCQKEGHISRDCPNDGGATRSGGGDASSRGNAKPRACFKCQKEGHISRDCPSVSQGGGGDFKSPGEEGKPDGPPRERYIPPEPCDDEASLFKTVPAGINFDQFDAIPVKVTGEDVPGPIQSFGEARFSRLLQDNIVKSHYSKPTPIQKYAIPAISSGRDLMACAQTGSGKTAAFLLPILHAILEMNLTDQVNESPEAQEPLALIVSPTRELSIQIYNEARKFSHDSSVKSKLVYGGTSTNYQAIKLREGFCHILVATPGRLLDFIEHGRISFRRIRFVVLDEADRMLDLGFLPSVRKIMEHPSMPPMSSRQTLMFSATFPEEVQLLAADFLNNYLFVAVGIIGGACTDVNQAFVKVLQPQKKGVLEQMLKSSPDERTLVFVEQKRMADFLASYLSQSGLATTSIHGDRLQREREEALEDFRSGRRKILVATAVAARGLDIRGVQHVVNYDLPRSVDEYIHRIGRTGRVGNTGRSTSFYDPNTDFGLITGLCQVLQSVNQPVPSCLTENFDENKIHFNPYTGTMASGFGGRDVRFTASGNFRRDPIAADKSNDVPSDTPGKEEDDW